MTWEGWTWRDGDKTETFKNNSRPRHYRPRLQPCFIIMN